MQILEFVIPVAVNSRWKGVSVIQSYRAVFLSFLRAVGVCLDERNWAW